MPDSFPSPRSSLVQETGGLTRGTLLTTLLAVFAAQVGGVLVASLLGEIATSLEITGSQLTWITAAYGVPTAVLTLSYGLIGDLFGHKKVLLAGTALLTVGEIVNSFAQSIGILLTGQAIAGFGAGAIFASALSLLSLLSPGARDRSKAIAAFTVAFGLGAAAGPLISGLVVHFGATWRFAFVPVAALAVIAGLLALVACSDAKAPAARSFDWAGQITAAVAVLAGLFAVVEGPALGWGSAPVVGGFVLAVVALAAFIVVELRAAEPMLRLSLFRSPAFTGAALIALLGYGGFIGTVYALAVRLEVGQQYEPLHSAALLLVVQLVPLALSPFLGGILRRVSPRLLLSVGLLPMVAGQVWLSRIPSEASSWAYVPAMLLLGVGFTFLVSSITAAAVGSVPLHLNGMAAAGNSLIREYAGAMAAGIFGSIGLSYAAGTLGTSLSALALPEPLQQVVGGIVADGGPLALAAAPLPAEFAAASVAGRDAIVQGYNVALLVCAGAVFVAAIIGATLLRGGRVQDAQEFTDHDTVVFDDNSAASPVPANRSEPAPGTVALA